MSILTLPDEPRKMSMFIDGQWCNSSDGCFVTRYSPGHNVAVSLIPSGTHTDTDRAIDVARQTFDSGEWANLTSDLRSDILLKASQLIRSNFKELAYLETLETGKPISQAQAEVMGTANTWQYASGALRNLAGETFNNQGSEMFALVIRQPVGVVGLILPWNFPFLLLGERLPFILAAGCCVVAKPAAATSSTTLEMARLLQEAGLPDGVFNVITGSGKIVGQRILESQKIDRISFTGSSTVGKGALIAAASNIKGVGLELGGKNPHLVFADADLEQAADGVAFGMAFNAGQCCVGGSRLIVESSIQESFVDLLSSKLQKIRVGDPLDTNTQVGAMFDSQHMEKVLGFIERAVDEGGQLVCGGKALTQSDGLFIQPALITGVDKTSEISTEEIFGPVIVVHSFNSYGEAIALANHSIYGLAASIWSNNLNTVIKSARDVQAGRVWVNTTLENGPEMPLGGMKASGIGREGGMMGIEEYTEVKSINIRLANKSPWIE